jgi:amidohydrolase
MKIDQQHLISKFKAVFEKMCNYREHLHIHPELSYKEFKTAKFVKQTLKSIGLTDIQSIGGTGVITTIYAKHHSKKDKCIAFRADLDALPIQELNDVKYKSQNEGVMHACGHDVHTSILLGLAEVLWSFKDQLPQPVKLIFQPGEEVNPGGANLIIDGGGLNNPEVSKIFALHVFPDFEFGNCGFREGLYMASSDELHVTIKGKGGHGALKGQTINPMFMGAEFIIAAEQYINTNTPKDTPSVINFGRFEALGSTNVIPEQALIKGTFRTMNEKWRTVAKAKLEDIAKKISEKYGGHIDLNISQGYPFLKNDPELTRSVKNLASITIGKDKVHDLELRMTAEDFAFYSHIVPVCFFRLGVGNISKGITYNVHHARFDIEPKSMLTGLKVFSSIAFSLDS